MIFSILFSGFTRKSGPTFFYVKKKTNKYRQYRIDVSSFERSNSQLKSIDVKRIPSKKINFVRSIDKNNNDASSPTPLHIETSYDLPLKSN